MSIDLDWQEKAILDSVIDGYIQKIINDLTDKCAQNIFGKVFPDATRVLLPFADADQRIVYIPNWVKNYFEPYEIQWIVFHEIGHIINNHKYANPQYDFIADEYAVRQQCITKFGIEALRKFSMREMILGRERTIHVDAGKIQLRINRLRGLGLPYSFLIK